MLTSLTLPRIQRLSVLTALFLTGCNQSNSLLPESEPVGDPIVDISNDDPEMQAAIAEAKANIDVFLAHLEEFPDDENMSIKAPIDTGGQIENIWIDGLQFDGQQFTGRLANEPHDLSTYKQGDEVTVPKDEITDWAFLDGDTMQGGYTVQVVEERTAD